MKLYLSSEGFGKHLKRLHELVGDDKRVLFIDNAKDYYNEQARTEHVGEKKLEFEAAGFEFFELDLRNYFLSPDKLKPIIEAAPFVWAAGGNTFVLRRAFAYSGLDSLINTAVKNGTVYGGSSAGSIIATNSLRGTENGDDPYVIPSGYKAEIIWDGLGFIYPQLVPHYESKWFGEESKAMSDYFETTGMKYETLKDGEVYVVDGDYEEKIT